MVIQIHRRWLGGKPRMVDSNSRDAVSFFIGVYNKPLTVAVMQRLPAAHPDAIGQYEVFVLQDQSHCEAQDFSWEVRNNELGKPEFIRSRFR
jgi:hypothetical protein